MIFGNRIKTLAKNFARGLGYTISRVPLPTQHNPTQPNPNRDKHAALVAKLSAKDGCNRLSEKVAVITGGASGIGAATAVLFAKEGARVIIADINDIDGRKLVSQIKANGGEAIFLHTDVSSDASCEHMVIKTVQSFGRLDILVNNAGIVVEGSLVDTTPSNWHLVMNVNLASIYRCSRAAIPQMLRGGDSSIINISSTQGLAGFMASAAYATSKGGVIALTRQMARDYSRSGIRVNCICPGVVLTPIFAKSDYRDSFFAMCDEFHPIGHCGLPEDIAYAALFLACNESSYVTGAIIPVDGGISSSGSY